MTLHAMQAAKGHRCTPTDDVSAAAQKAVLLLLADRTGPDGAVFPTSQRTLARWSQLSRRSVQRVLDALAASGDLRLIVRGDGADTARYRLGEWYVPELAEDRGGARVTPGGRQGDARGAPGRRPKARSNAVDAENRTVAAPKFNPKAAREAREALAEKVDPTRIAAANARLAKMAASIKTL